jgi:acyl-CoA thioester hydrolase
MVFEHPFRVQPADIDQMGHVNNVVYLRYAQDAAAAHWFAFASEEHLESFVWVARRHEIDYLRPALKDDELLARTWVGEATGATYERFVEITRPKDSEVLARVRSIWVLLDAKSHRPRRITEELRARFGCDPGRNGK